jgi:hypothetical protein
MSQYAEEIFEKYPFLSLVTYGGNEYIGIIQNQDDAVLSIYDFGRLNSDEYKNLFLNLGETWWWESNRMIPINLFLKREWDVFHNVLLTLNVKDCIVVYGSSVSINDLAKKRSKRRNIQLVRKVK